MTGGAGKTPAAGGAGGRAVRLLERAFAATAAVAMFAVMVIVCLDVAFRYALNRPIPWAFDVISMYAMVAIFYLMLAPSYAHDHHIRIDILSRRLPPRSWRRVRALQIACVLPIFALIAWLAAGEASEAYRESRVIAGPIAWPTWPGPALVAVGSVLLVARFLLQLFERAGRVPDERETAHLEM